MLTFLSDWEEEEASCEKFGRCVGGGGGGGRSINKLLIDCNWCNLSRSCSRSLPRSRSRVWLSLRSSSLLRSRFCVASWWCNDPDDASILMALDQIRRPSRRSRRSPVKCPSVKIKFVIYLSDAEVTRVYGKYALTKIPRIIFHKREIFQAPSLILSYRLYFFQLEKKNLCDTNNC